MDNIISQAVLHSHGYSAMDWVTVGYLLQNLLTAPGCPKRQSQEPLVSNMGGSCVWLWRSAFPNVGPKEEPGREPGWDTFAATACSQQQVE